MTSAVSFRGGRSEQASVGAATIGQRRRAGVIILIVGGGGISLGATHLGDGDVVDHAAAIRVAIAEVQVGDEAGLALADWVGRVTSKVRVEVARSKPRSRVYAPLNQPGVIRRSTPLGPLAVLTSIRRT